MKTINSASASYEGMGKDGKGHVSTKSGALDNPYGFKTRFEDAAGTNPEEMIAAAHAACFTMATSFQLAEAGHENGTLHTTCDVTLEGDGEGGFDVTKSALKLTGKLPGVTKEEFEELAAKAKEGCPISKLFNCEITLETEFEG
ncbi:OsmC family protein [Erythrobacter sp. MTPC3]|uniref:OsmC family protein n=1 Tax=Erythrobacter sp. MTPC3 TaxID=3056564 RepID=UPI0036F3BF38